MDLLSANQLSQTDQSQASRVLEAGNFLQKQAIFKFQCHSVVFYQNNRMADGATKGEPTTSEPSVAETTNPMDPVNPLNPLTSATTAHEDELSVLKCLNPQEAIAHEKHGSPGEDDPEAIYERPQRQT